MQMTDAAALVASIALTSHLQERLDKEMRYRGGVPPPPLRDVIHKNGPNLEKYEEFIDLIPTILGCMVLALVLRGDINIKPLLRAIAAMFLLRCICFFVTGLPSPCEGRVPKSCGGMHDCIYSGHTALTLIFAYFIWCYDPSTAWLLILYCIVGSMLIIATRAHYTIDVLVAWIATYMIINVVVRSEK